MNPMIAITTRQLLNLRRLINTGVATVERFVSFPNC